jgi:hypothetical protein
MEKHWKWIAVGAVVAAVAYIFFVGMPAKAADLGGNCCADLEERIADLEATTARKGNRKMSLTFYGEVNKAIRLEEWDDTTISASLNGVSLGSVTIPGTGGEAQDVIDNSASPSFFGVRGEAVISGDWKAGYVAEVGIGGFDDNGTNDIYLRRGVVYLDGGSVGKVTVGHGSQATDDLDRITTANTTVAIRPLSPAPLTGPGVGEAFDLYDGTRADLIRYDSTTVAGFTASASWASGNDGGDVWDAALRYKASFEQVNILAGVGYRHGLIVNSLGSVDEDVLDLDVFTAVASAMHVPTGVFVTANYGRIDGDLFGAFPIDSDAWAVTAGIEQKFFPVGKTTIFGEYGDGTLDVSFAALCTPFCTALGVGLDATYWGGGVVQNFEGAATNIYANVRFYEVGAGFAAAGGGNSFSLDIETEAVVGTVGAQIKF